MRKMPPQKPATSEQIVGTPPEFILALCRFLHIDHFAWDLAATRGVNECSPYGCYTVEDDSLQQSWNFSDVHGGWGYLNPEFGQISKFVQKAWGESCVGAQTAVLVPASIGSRWWLEWVVDKATVVPLRGRIAFVGRKGTYPKDCVVLLYGPAQIPGYQSPWKWMDLLTDEEKEMAKKRIGKPAKKKAKRASKMDRKLTKPDVPKNRDNVRPIAAGRTKKRTPPPEDRVDTVPEPARVTTFKPNGASSASSIPEPAAVDLGPIVLPDPEASQKFLGELAQLNDRALDAEARYLALKEATKHAKEKYDDLASEVIKKLRQGTHASDLPLFADIEQREADQARMEAAAPIPDPDPDAISAAEGEGLPPVDDGAEDAPLAAQAGAGEEIPEGVPLMPPPSPDAPAGIQDEEIPF